ncbi:hypothetical protein MBLNU457_6685t1 [Dothideomycetes sp. NU457]
MPGATAPQRASRPSVGKGKGKAKDPEFDDNGEPIIKIFLTDEQGDVHRFSCRPCVDGHRAPKCGLFKHMGPNRVYVRKPEPGRPNLTCPHAGRNGCKCVENRHMACQPTPYQMVQLRAGHQVNVEMWTKYEVLEQYNLSMDPHKHAGPLGPVAVWSMRGENPQRHPGNELARTQLAQLNAVPGADAPMWPANGQPNQPGYPGNSLEANLANALGANSGRNIGRGMSPIGTFSPGHIANSNGAQMGSFPSANMAGTYDAPMGNFPLADMAYNNGAQMGTFSQADMANYNDAQMGGYLPADMANNYGAPLGNFSSAGMANNVDPQLVNYSPADMANPAGAHMGYFLQADMADTNGAPMGNFSQAGMANNAGAHPGNTTWEQLAHPYGEGPSSNSRAGQPRNDSFIPARNSGASAPGQEFCPAGDEGSSFGNWDLSGLTQDHVGYFM